MNTIIYTVGRCGVLCGDVVGLRAKQSGKLLFWCPDCENTYTAPPMGRSDEINALVDLAPSGVELATSEDAERLRVRGCPAKRLAKDDRFTAQELTKLLEAGKR